MEPLEALRHLAVAAALGSLVGLQRQREGNLIGGIRTFPLIAAFGTLCALLAPVFGPWLVGVGLVTLTAILVLGNLLTRDAADPPGITTEIAALVVFLIGAYLPTGAAVVAAVATGVVALLLHLKGPLHDLVRRMGPEDITAVMQFVLISLVVLPLLPDRYFGPFAVLNPREIWLMVTLMVGLSLLGYVAAKSFGARGGALLGGILGGLVSSTATTASAARRVTSGGASAATGAVIIGLASAVAVGRVLVEIAAAAPGSFTQMAPPIVLVLVTLVITAVAFVRRQVGEPVPQAVRGNPAELRSALIFAGLYAVILLAVAASREWFGSSGLYLVSFISGLTDVDAITLSTARMVADNRLPADQGWRMVLIATLANLGFKGGLAAMLGGRQLGKLVLVSFGVATVVGLVVLVAWPAGGP